jgi:hypothetical protein
VDKSGVYPADFISPWFSMLVNHLGVNNRPVGGCSSEMSHFIDMMTMIIIIIILEICTFALNIDGPDYDHY